MSEHVPLLEIRPVGLIDDPVQDKRVFDEICPDHALGIGSGRRREGVSGVLSDKAVGHRFLMGDRRREPGRWPGSQQCLDSSVNDDPTHHTGGAKGIRTPDPLPAEQVLYQLSYSPGALAGVEQSS